MNEPERIDSPPLIDTEEASQNWGSALAGRK
jgi:hypothetical protein